MKRFIVLFIVFNLCCSYTYAHGNLSIRIKEKTQEISKHPRKAVLYFERGYLYQQHYEYHKAINDYKKAEKLGSHNKLIDYRKALAYHELGRQKKALFCIQSYYTKNAIDVKARKLEAQVLIKLKRYDHAFSAYNYIFKHTIDLRPNDVISYSEVALMIDKKNYDKAIEIINLGLEKLGNQTIVLQMQKIAYLKKKQHYQDVIDIYNSIIINQIRKETWYFQKATYLFEIGHLIQANISLQQAKVAIKELSLRLQNTIAVKNLADDIHLLEAKITL